MKLRLFDSFSSPNVDTWFIPNVEELADFKRNHKTQHITENDISRIREIFKVEASKCVVRNIDGLEFLELFIGAPIMHVRIYKYDDEWWSVTRLMKYNTSGTQLGRTYICDSFEGLNDLIIN